MSRKGASISLGKRLRTCPSFKCLGVVPNWDDYSDADRQTIFEAEKVHYPTALYEDVFLSLGKEVFPRNSCRFIGSKIRQTALFQFLGIPHPKTRLYYGANRAARICADFRYPFIAKTPTGSSMGTGVYLIKNEHDLAEYLDQHLPAFIQEYLDIDKDLRVVIIAGRPVHAYWRMHCAGEFRNNVSRGAEISYENITREALDFAAGVALRCRFDEVGLDICDFEGKFYVIEANMVYGLEGFRRVGLDPYEILAELDCEGLL